MRVFHNVHMPPTAHCAQVPLTCLDCSLDGVLAGILHQRYVVQEVTAIGRAMECVSNESNRPSSIAC